MAGTDHIKQVSLAMGTCNTFCIVLVHNYALFVIYNMSRGVQWSLRIKDTLERRFCPLFGG